jgi:hypothetical protein
MKKQRIKKPKRDKTKPRVLVGCPTHISKNYALKEWVKTVKSLTYSNYDILLVDNSDDNEYMKKIKSTGIRVVKGPLSKSTKQRIVDSRNLLREKCLEGNYDFLLSLEQDVIPPLNIIEMLMDKSAPIVAGVYLNIFKNNFGKLEPRPLAYARVSQREFDILKTDKKYEGTEIRKRIEEGKIKGPDDIKAQLSMKEVEKPRLIEVLFTGLGCMLIRKEVLEKIKFRASEASFDDYMFCIDAQKEGYPVFLDTTAKCAHLLPAGKVEDKRN